LIVGALRIDESVWLLNSGNRSEMVNVVEERIRRRGETSRRRLDETVTEQSALSLQ